MKNKQLLIVFTTLLFVFVGCSQKNITSDDGAENNNYPNDSIEVLVPYPAGSGTDTIARPFVKYLEDSLPGNESITIDNIGGGGGVKGIASFLKADSDGYNIAMTPSNVFTIQTQFEGTPYDLGDFEPVANITVVHQSLLVGKESSWESIEEFTEYAKAHPDEVTVSTAGEGTTQHMALEMLNKEANIALKHIPQDGAGEARVALQGGHVDAIVVPFSDDDQDKFHPLVTFSEDKNEKFPEIPVAKEVGINVSSSVYHSLYVPKGTPKDIIDIISNTAKVITEDSEFIDFIMENTQAEVNYLSSEELMEKLETESDKFETAMRETGLID